MGKSSLVFCQAINPWHGSIHWAAKATIFFQKAGELFNHCTLAVGEIPRHVVMVCDRVNCADRYILADLLRLLVTRDLRLPLYLDKLGPLVQRAAEVVASCLQQDSGHKFEVTLASVKELGHVMAEIQSVFNEYGFCRCVDSIPDPEEAAKRLDVLRTKIGQLENNTYDGDAAAACLALRSVGAQMEGIRQALPEETLSSFKEKFLEIGQIADGVLTNLVNQHCSSPQDASLKSYVDAEKLLHKAFVRSIYSNSDVSAVTSHVIHTGTRGWIIEAVQKWLDSDKTLFYLAAQSGTGKTAASSAVCKLFPRELAAYHVFEKCKRNDFYNTTNGLVQSIASSMLKSLPEYLNYMNGKHGESDLKSQLSKSWQDSYNLLIRDPLREIYANTTSQRHMIVIDALDEIPRPEWATLKEFLTRFTTDLPKSFCVYVSAQTKNLPQFITALHDENVDGIRLDDRAWVNRHIKDIELYIAGSLGAVLCGEDEADAPNRAKSDESTLQNVVDELLKCSAGRFDYALDLIGTFAREMGSSSQFLSSLKKAMGHLRCSREPEFEDKLTEFANPYRAYRDKEGRTVNVRVLKQSQFLMDMSRAAIVRTNHKAANGNILIYN